MIEVLRVRKVEVPCMDASATHRSSVAEWSHCLHHWTILQQARRTDSAHPLLEADAVHSSQSMCLVSWLIMTLCQLTMSGQDRSIAYGSLYFCDRMTLQSLYHDLGSSRSSTRIGAEALHRSCWGPPMKYAANVEQSYSGETVRRGYGSDKPRD